MEDARVHKHRAHHLARPLLAAAGCVLLARAAGASWADLGLEPSRLGPAARVGAAAAALAAGTVGSGLVAPATRELFADERVTELSPRDTAFEVLVRIPLATAVAEELVFRSAVLGVGLRRTSTARAVALSSLVFGCWHVRSARRAHEANPGTAAIAARAGGQRATVAATVLATTAAGVGFAVLRLRTRSVVAPIIVHAALNAAAFAGARAVHGHRSRR